MDINNSIQELKNNKAPREDKILSEMRKLGAARAADNLHRLTCNIWENETIPVIGNVLLHTRSIRKETARIQTTTEEFRDITYFLQSTFQGLTKLSNIKETS